MEESDTVREIRIIPNFSAVHEQFYREFEANVKAAIRDAVVTEEEDSLRLFRETIVHLNIAIQNIDTIELLNAFRARLMVTVTELVDTHDRLQREAEPEEEGEGEPEQEDLVTYDDKHFFSVGSYSTFDVRLNRNCAFVVGEDEDRDDAIVAYMEKRQFWPNAWSISDHGNTCLINLSKPEVKA